MVERPDAARADSFRDLDNRQLDAPTLPWAHASSERWKDTTVFFDARAYRITLHRYVAPESTFTSQVFDQQGSLADTFRYWDNAVDLALLRDADTLLFRSFRKQDFASVSGADFVEDAQLHNIWYEDLIGHGQGVRLSAGVYVPDTDVGDHILIELTADTVRMDVAAYD